MTTVRSDTDVIIVGSTLGGLVPATYLARAGLRVVLLEEQTHRKRPVLLREPFLLPGLGSQGPVREVLRELALPLIEQREIRTEPVSVQVILPDARIDACPDTKALSTELESYELGARATTLRWLELLAEQGRDMRDQLWHHAAPVSSGSTRAPNLTQRLQRAVAVRPPAGVSIATRLPDTPAGLRGFAEALVRGLSGCSDGLGPAPALLIDGACRANNRMPDSTTPFLDLFRRRFIQLHGEVWTVDSFGVISTRGELGIELPNRRALARALVIAAPRDPLQSFLDENGDAPRWLRKGLPVATAAAEIFRAERDQLPVGLGTRVIVAQGLPEDVLSLAFHPDRDHEGVEWLVAAGPGSRLLNHENPLQELAPFSTEGLVRVDPGPTPRWDLDTRELVFPAAVSRPMPRQRAPIALVGPELTPGLGPEGEILQARNVALELIDRLARD